MSALITIVVDIASVLPSEVPDPGQGEAPPGSEGIMTLLRWLAYIAVAACVAGVIIAGTLMALQLRRAEGGESVTKLGWVLAAAIIIGSASGLVAALI